MYVNVFDAALNLLYLVWQRNTTIGVKGEINSGTGLSLMLQAAKWLFEE